MEEFRIQRKSCFEFQRSWCTLRNPMEQAVAMAAVAATEDEAMEEEEAVGGEAEAVDLEMVSTAGAAV